MSKQLPGVVVGVAVLLVIVGGVIVWQKSKAAPEEAANNSGSETMIKKIDMTTQPEWVQKLSVTAKKGVSPNGLNNVTVTVAGMPVDTADSLSYVVQYQTSNKGTQGALGSSVSLAGLTTISRTIDFGTCSTKSCVRHDGVTAIELEIDFNNKTGDQSYWVGTLSL